MCTFSLLYRVFFPARYSLSGYTPDRIKSRMEFATLSLSSLYVTPNQRSFVPSTVTLARLLRIILSIIAGSRYSDLISPTLSPDRNSGKPYSSSFTKAGVRPQVFMETY